MFKFFTAKRNYLWANSLLIAVSSALLCKETFIVANVTYPDYDIYLVAFLTTLYAYLFYPLVNYLSDQKFKATSNFGLIFLNPFFYGVIGFVLITAFYIPTIFSFSIICLIGLLTLLYFGKIIPERKFSIRKIYFAKTIILSMVWSMTTVLLPISFAGENIFSNAALFIFARRFFFIAALTIPFEIRDRHHDAVFGDHSFVNLIGIAKSKLLAFGLLCSYLLLAVIQYQLKTVELSFLIAMIFSFLFSAISILIYHPEKKNSWLVLFITDGMLIVQFFLISAAAVLKQ